MFVRFRMSLALGLLAAAALLLGGADADAQGEKINRKTVPFKTADGVELSGTLYPNPGGKRDAVVLLLHDFDLKKGGSSLNDGWSNLAVELQKDGYVVFTFDFRGFGGSTSVDKKFWDYTHNGINNIRKGRGKGAIDHKDFAPGYAPYFVNDIAAAKAYLDRRNDAKELNSSNVILIGAGEGATLGAMWLAGECRRARDKTGFGNPGDPESKDIAAAVWLSIGPKVGSRSLANTLSFLVKEAGSKDRHKIPTLFVYGKNDSNSNQLSDNLYKAINPLGAKSKELKRTGKKAIPDTKLAGHHLLGKEHDTVKIIRGHLAEVMEDRGSRESVKREGDKYAYVYLDRRGKPVKVNKPVGEEVPLVDLNFILGIK